MADGVDITAGSGTKIATDDTGANGHVQLVKIAYSADGSSTHVSADAGGLLVNLGANNDVTVTGTVTAQDGGGSLTVDNSGTFAVQAAQSGTWNVNNVSGTISLPTGAATAANQSTMIGHLDGVEGLLNTIDQDTGKIAGAVTGTEMQVDIVSAPTITVADGGSSLTVDGTVAATQSGAWNVGITGAVTLPTGASTSANQSTIIGHLDGVEGLLTTIDADTSALAGAVAGTELQVDIVSAPTLNVADGGSSLTVDGTVAATQSGVWSVGISGDVSLPTGAATSANQSTIIGHLDGVEGLLTTIDADTSALAGAVSGTELQVDIVSAPTITVADGGSSLTVDGTVAATQSGTWNIGDVSGTVTLPTGAATSSNQSTIIGHLDGVEGLLTTIDADTSALASAVAGTELQVDIVSAPTINVADGGSSLTVDGTVAVSGTVAVNGSGFTQPVSGTVTVQDGGASITVDGTVASTQSGTWETSITGTVPLPTGASTSANQTTIIGHLDGVETLLSTIDADTGTIAGAVVGTEMQVDIVSAPTLNVADGGSSLTVDGTVAATQSGSWTVGVSGTVAVTDNASSLTVDAPVGAPVFVQLSDGASSITTLPVSLASSPLPTGASTSANQSTIIGHLDGVEGLLTTIDADTSALAGAVAGTELQVDIVSAPTLNVADGGSSLTVDGTVAATQSGSWSVGLTPGNVISVVDNSGSLTVDAPVGTPVFVRLSDGTSAIATLPVSLYPHAGLVGDPYTLTSKTNQWTSSQTSAALWTPASTKKLVITKLQIQTGGTTAGAVQVWFGASADTSYTRGTDLAIFDGEFAPSATIKPGAVLDGPWIASAADHVLKVASSAAINPLTVTAWGYEI